MYQETDMSLQSDVGPGWEEQPKNYMALASMILGILSIVTVCCFFTGMMFGGLAVLFAALSRVDVKMNGQGRVGLITGIIGIVLGCVSIVLWASLSS